MSTVPRPSKRPRTPTEADPFFYGWRDVWQANGHGGKTLVQLPLTEEDILHPQEGDFVIQNTPHGLDCIYLFNVGQICLVDRPHDDILYDLLIHWDIPGLRGTDRTSPWYAACGDGSSGDPSMWRGKAFGRS